VNIPSANVRQAYDLALAGAIGAVCGLYLYVELVHAESIWARDALAGVAIGGTIGFFLNAWGPARDGAWLKLARDATWGALAGAIGGAADVDYLRRLSSTEAGTIFAGRGELVRTFGHIARVIAEGGRSLRTLS
jgi:hypothetical protein